MQLNICNSFDGPVTLTAITPHLILHMGSHSAEKEILDSGDQKVFDVAATARRIRWIRIRQTEKKKKMSKKCLKFEVLIRYNKVAS